jgi:excisionase family DNA binding protein
VEQVERRTLSVSEAAQVLGISRAHAYDCVRTGELPSITLGRRVVVPRQAIEELLARGSSDESAAHG